MARSSKIKVSPIILKKLRKNSGYSIEELAKKLDVTVEKIVQVEEGKDSFTLTQIKKLTDIYKVPLAAFFSKDIPDIPSLPDYRINRERKLNPEVNIAIRRAKYLSEEIKELSGKVSKIPSFTDRSPEKIARSFRKYLEIEIPKKRKAREILEFYKEVLEDRLNILIIEYPLKADDVRAFSIFSDLAVIVLNESDEPQVKLFSLFHEVAHLLKRESGICSIDIEAEKYEVERFCDKFAAEFLVPAEDLVTELGVKEEPTDEEMRKIAKHYGVSLQVMMLRLLELGIITKERYQKFKERFDKAKLEAKKGGVRDWEMTYINRSGRLAIAEVSKAYRRGEISFYEAMRVLDLKPKYAEKIIE